MDLYPEALENLIVELSKLPSIGKKSAERLALHLMEYSNEDIQKFRAALLDIKTRVQKCKVCGNYTEDDICDICKSPSRDKTIVCVVEDCKNLIAIEKSGEYKGLYHVLGGLISPLNNVLAEDINLDSLLERVENPEVKEVILAISPTVEGEMTTLFLAELLKNRGVKVSRIASGIPIGASIEFYDSQTLFKALEDRREL